MKSRRLSRLPPVDENSDLNVDEVELFEMQSAKEEMQRRSMTPKKPGKKQPLQHLQKVKASPLRVKHMDNSQISALYSQCIQLSTNNKINMANSWQLPLIDYIEEVLQADEMENQETNFQKASCTLDASVKIYSYRVDSVHQHTFKVLGGLNRTDNNNDEDVDNEGLLDDEDEEEKVKVKPSKIRRGGHTIETNMANINVKQLQIAFEVDPLFRKTSAAFDEAGAKGLLLHNLSVYDGCNLVFDSSDRIVSEDTEVDVVYNNSIDFSDVLPLIKPNDGLICPPLLELIASIERLSQGENSVNAKKEPKEVNAPLPGAQFAHLNAQSVDSFLEFDRVKQVEKRIMDEVAMSDDADMDFGGDHYSDGGENFENMPQVSRSLESTLALVAQSSASDYSFFQPRGVNWMGADHWKFQNTKKVESKVTSKLTKSKKSKVEFSIDFYSTPVSQLSLMPNSKASTILPANSVAEELLMDDDHSIQADMLLKLRLKPHVRVSRWKSVGKENGDVSLTYKYDNPNDEMYVPDPSGFEGQDDYDDDGDNFDQDHNVIESLAQNLGELKLVSAPRKVNKIDISYAKYAKKVDIQALKEGLWEALSSESVSQNIEKSDMNIKECGTFQDSIKTLQASITDTDTLNNISVPYCFICLLHLANEKNLALEADGSMGNFNIVQNLVVNERNY